MKCSEIRNIVRELGGLSDYDVGRLLGRGKVFRVEDVHDRGFLERVYGKLVSFEPFETPIGEGEMARVDDEAYELADSFFMRKIIRDVRYSTHETRWGEAPTR